MSHGKTEALLASILVVDDDLNNLRLLREVLSRRGYDVRPIRDGRMVLSAVQAKPPDLILLDIMMPVLNGFEVCAQLKADEMTCNIPVIFLSALHEAEEKVHAFSAGAVDYITKPFQTQEVIARIENQLQICRLQKQLQEQNQKLQQEVRERQLMEEKLRSAQEEIRGFFEAMADIVLIVDVQGNTIKIAPTNPHKLYPPETDVLGQTIELLFGQEGEILRSQIQRALQAQQVLNHEYSLIIGQEQIWFSASIAPITENTVAWVARDISDRKKAEDELRLLLETTQIISQAPDLDTALTDILRLISHAIDWDCAEAWLPNPEATALAASSGWYGQDQCLDHFRQSRQTFTFAPGQGLPGRVWLSGTPEWIEDVSEVDESTFDRVDRANRAGLKAAFAVPVVGDEVQGSAFQWSVGNTDMAYPASTQMVLVFFKRSADLKDDRVLRVVTAIATLISSFMKRKQAETALRLSQERLHLALEGSSLALWDWNLLTDQIYRDCAWKEMLGYDEWEIAGTFKAFENLLHPDDRPTVHQGVNACLQGENSFCEVEFRMRAKSGDWKWILCRGKVSERNRSGEPIRMTGTYRDISARKATEEALVTSQARLEKLTASVPGVIYEYVQNKNGSERFEYISSGIRDLQELEPEVVLRNPNCFFAQIHPEDWPGYCEALAISVITLEPFHYEWRNITPSGQLKWLEALARPERRDQGDIVWYGVVFDISDRKRAEQEISAARERLELVLRASQDGFWDWDFQTQEIYFSPRYKEMLGYRDEELRNELSTWKKLIFPEDYTAALKLIEDYNSSQIPYFLTTQRFYHKNGSTVYILSRAIHLKDQNGNIIRMVGAHTDITNLKQTEEALQKAVLAADAANRSKSEFLANMSHELRTPLNAILGFSQIMSHDQTLSLENQKNLNIINRAGEHLLALIDDILEVSKIEAGRTSFNESTFDLRQLLNSLEQMLKLKASSKGLQLTFEYGSDIPQYVITDEGKLRQVLLNLVGNAIKFTKTGRVRLWVSTVKNPLKVTYEPSVDTKSLTLYFEIEDTGCGIAPEEIHLLFEAFGQTESGRKSQQGTGLGLPISQKYVQLMGGEIKVTSTLGQGSIFAFNIGVGLTESEAVQIQPCHRQVIGLAPNQPEYRILIVDDVVESRLLLNTVLTPIGFVIREADNGKDAVEIWRQWQPHLILMDMRMPRMNGYEATRQIRLEEEQRTAEYSSSLIHHSSSAQGQLLTINPSQSAHLPCKTVIFALTASGFDEQRKIMISEGCDDLVRKPFKVNILLDKISEYLGVKYEWQSMNQSDENLETVSKRLGDSEVLNLLSQMLPEWVQELYDAASECSDDVVFKLLEKIPEENTLLANALRDLAENFQFAKIMKLAQGDLK